MVASQISSGVIFFYSTDIDSEGRLLRRPLVVPGWLAAGKGLGCGMRTLNLAGILHRWGTKLNRYELDRHWDPAERSYSRALPFLEVAWNPLLWSRSGTHPDSMGVPKGVKLRSAMLYRKCIRRRLTKGRNPFGMALAVVSLSLQAYGISHSLPLLERRVGPGARVGRCMQAISGSGEPSRRRAKILSDTVSCVEGLCLGEDVGSDVKGAACLLAVGMSTSRRFSRRSVRSIAGAAVHEACLRRGVRWAGTRLQACFPFPRGAYAALLESSPPIHPGLGAIYADRRASPVKYLELPAGSPVVGGPFAPAFPFASSDTPSSGDLAPVHSYSDTADAIEGGWTTQEDIGTLIDWRRKKQASNVSEAAWTRPPSRRSYSEEEEERLLVRKFETEDAELRWFIRASSSHPEGTRLSNAEREFKRRFMGGTRKPETDAEVCQEWLERCFYAKQTINTDQGVSD